MHIRFFTIYFCLFAAQVFSQSNQMLNRQARLAMMNKDWYGASQYYQRLYQRDSLSHRNIAQYADAARLNYETDRAIMLYRRLISGEHEKRYPLSFYWLGELYKNKMNYEEAKKYFLLFSKLNLKKEKYGYYNKKSRQQAEACDHVRVLMKHPLDLKVQAIEGPLNTKMSEYAPYEFDSTIYFSSIKVPERRDQQTQGNEYSMIYYSLIRKGKMQKVKAMDTLVNARNYHTANIHFSADRKRMVISRCTSLNAAETSCELYMSRLNGKKWSVPERLPEPVNTDGYSSTQPFFGQLQGNEVLFFSSNRPGGAGNYDIWYAVFDGSRFVSAQNCGSRVNTADDEITPWFDQKNNQLYFSSTWHKGFGGYDIFRSGFSDGTFSEPENAGWPVNSSYNDLYFNVNESGTRALLSSNRKGSLFEGSQNCCNDIYTYSIDTTRPREVVLDTISIKKEEMKLLVPLTLFFNNDQPDPKTRNTVTNVSYDSTWFQYMAKRGEYERIYTRGLKGNEKENAADDIDVFFRDSVEAGYENLEKFADRMLSVLMAGETVKITMKGYCSPLASTDYNINLAKRRISSLRNYFHRTRNGVFLPYINNTGGTGGRIVFEDVDVGELQKSRASDLLSDTRNSVYSPEAASERKIQIIAVSFMDGAQ